MLITVFENGRVVSSTQKKFRARDAVKCFNIFLSAGNNPGVLKNSSEHAKPLFIEFRQFPQMTLISLRISLRQCTRRRPRVTGLALCHVGLTKSNWSFGIRMLTINLAPVIYL